MEWKDILDRIRIIKEHFDRSYKCLNHDRPTRDETVQSHIENLLARYEQVRVILNVNYSRLTKGHQLAAEGFFLELKTKLTKIAVKKNIPLQLPESLHDPVTTCLGNHKELSTPDQIPPQLFPRNTNVQNSKMSRFEYAIAQKLPVLAITSDEKRNSSIRDFLNGVEFYHDSLDANGQSTLIKFLLKCKIQGQALDELGTLEPATFADLKTALYNKCGAKETLETIQNRLNNARQGNRSLKTFVQEVEELIGKLTELEVATHDETARTILRSANEKRGLVHLKRGVHDRYKIILDSARHTDFQEAANHLIELDPGLKPSEAIRYLDRPADEYRNNRRRNYNRGNYRNYRYNQPRRNDYYRGQGRNGPSNRNDNSRGRSENRNDNSYPRNQYNEHQESRPANNFRNRNQRRSDRYNPNLNHQQNTQNGNYNQGRQNDRYSQEGRHNQYPRYYTAGQTQNYPIETQPQFQLNNRPTAERPATHMAITQENSEPTERNVSHSGLEILQ